MSKKVLVAYASRSGATEGVAQAIGKTLADGGVQVDVRRMQDVQDLASYSAVVAGSAIRGQKWLPEAMKFLRTHRAELATKPFAAFLVCITLSMPGDKYRDGVAGWMAPVRALVKPVSEGLFAGTLEFAKLPLTFNTLGMRLPVAMGLWSEGDHRDWNAIRAWAESTRPLLMQ